MQQAFFFVGATRGAPVKALDDSLPANRANSPYDFPIYIKWCFKA